MRSRSTVTAALLIALFWLQMLTAVRRQTQTNDETLHAYAGFRYAECGDFAINPEHPPLMKWVVGTALRVSRTPHLSGCGTEATDKFSDYASSSRWLYKTGFDADRVLFRARLAASLFAVALGVGTWLLASALFGELGGIFALAWLAFEPNLLANGPLVTTDVAFSATLMFAVWALWSYWHFSSWARLVTAGVCAGLCLDAKHSGVLVIPILLMLWALECTRRGEWRSGRRWLSLVAACVMAYAVLWAAYGFRYWPRPHGAPLTMTLDAFLAQVREQQTRGLLVDHIIPFLARHHLAPLAYLYGFVDVLNISNPGQPPFLWGKLYPHGQWFYFPVAFVIKNTLPLMIAVACALWIGRRRGWGIRAAYVLVPIAVVLMAGMSSGLNIGYRHILPISGFLCVLAGAWCAEMISTMGNLRFAALAVLACHAGSSLFAWPNYIPYSNEIFGRSTHTYRYLTDANSDWGQELKQTRAWLDRNGIRDCWIAYDGLGDLDYYSIPCKRLPSNQWDSAAQVVPEHADGVFVISGLSMSGIEWETTDLNPYWQFFRAKPIAVVDGGHIIYRGTFDMRLARAIGFTAKANLGNDIPEEKLKQAQEAVALAPTSVRAHIALGQALEALQQRPAAAEEYRAAIEQANKTGETWYSNELAAARTGLKRVEGSGQ